jgi:hypothetical protein
LRGGSSSANKDAPGEKVTKFNPVGLKLTIIAMIICTAFVHLYLFIKPMIFPERLSENTVDISRYENRFLTLRQSLQRGIVGYISDDADDTDVSKTRLAVARYALSPVIIVRSLDYPLIVGNFHSRIPDYETYRKKGLIRVRDFSNGIVLFRRVSR